MKSDSSGPTAINLVHLMRIETLFLLQRQAQFTWHAGSMRSQILSLRL